MTVGDWTLLLGLVINAAATLYGVRRMSKKVDAVQIADNKRLDVVAEQAAEAAKLLVEAQAVTVGQHADTQGRLDEISKDQKQIHTLVNSNLTVEKQRSLLALKGQRILLKDNIDLRKNDANSEAAGTLVKLDQAILELQTELAERGYATTTADDERSAS